VWSPCLKCEVKEIEKVQRRFTKRLKGLQNVSQSDRLCRLGLPSLELRRLHLDFIFCYKLVFNLVSVNFSRFFVFSHVQKTRGHVYKLYKPRSNCSVSSRFFAERVVNVWNDLPSTVNFVSLASFKRTIRDVDFSEYMRCY